MPVTAGKRIGSYEVLSAIGKGGMGEVYRARDTRLDRHVAIKALPEEFERDAEWLARFQREAKLLASLNHPNIAAIYGLEEYEGSHVLVLELVDGVTLDDRLKRGAISLEEALAIAVQITEALEAAHEKGVIHRDLKPANIKLDRQGTVKVLDFGLAKMREADSSGVSLSNSPTIMSASVPGMIVGTAAYMSPEQAKGKETDRTTDIWAFGCVLFEMLTGRAVFEGETVGEILGGVFKAEPEWKRLPAETPESIHRLLRRCLEKDRKERLQHIGDARIEIREAQTGAKAAVHAVTPASRRERLLWLSALILVTVIAAVLAVSIFRPAPEVPERRLDITTPPTTDVTSFAVSPDGLKIVFEGMSDGVPKLWLRSLDSTSSRTIPGTDRGISPFWSPDSRSIGFFADGKLKRVDLDGSALQVLANTVRLPGGSWNREGLILYSATRTIWRVPSSGGDPVEVTQANDALSGQVLPHFLPDGRDFLFYINGPAELAGVYVGNVDRKETRRLMTGDSGAVYTPLGRLLFARQGTLFAQPFDVDRLTFTGTQSAIAVDIPYGTLLTVSAAFASAGGIIAYRSSAQAVVQNLAWFDRSGKQLKRIDAIDRARGVSISADGRRVTFSREQTPGVSDVWVLDIDRGAPTKFTFDRAANPTWSPDGNRIVYTSGRSDLYVKSTLSGGLAELFLQSSNSKSATDWSRDGRFVLYREQEPKGGYDIWAVAVDGERKPLPLVQTPYDDRDAQFSPDGKWIAYQSNESGRYEIYLQPFPGPGPKSMISSGGGTQVRWRRDGKELFYVAPDGRLMSVAVGSLSNGALDLATPVALFQTRLASTAGLAGGRQQYDVSLDGQQFLMNTYADTGTEIGTSPITVILNWKPKP